VSIRDKIAAVEDITSESVTIPEWGVTVEVRSMTAGARGEMLADCLKDGEMDVKALTPALVIGSTFDPETGEPVFTRADVQFIEAKNSAAVDRIAAVAMRLSGLEEDAKDKAGKDSSSTETGDSPS